jgi:dephospho-CoA kinase
MLKVGITGGIASGKTTVCYLFEKLFQTPIYFADTRAKEIIEKNDVVKNNIIELFGEQAYINNQYNRKFIASKVFEDKSLLQQLNQIVHPAVFEDAQQFFFNHQKDEYILYESAIMFESKSNLLMDKIILVNASKELRIERAIKRDTLNRKEIEQRINSQITFEAIQEKCDYIIQNDDNNNLESQVITIHQEILNSTKKK